MVSLLIEARIQTEMKLFENSLDLVIMTIFQENLKIDFLNSFFKVSQKLTRSDLIMFFIHYEFLK